MSGPSLVLETPAKLNLHLEVLGRRADGFHELETVMASVDLTDTLVMTPAEGVVELTCHADSLTGGTLPPAGPENLVVRAADLLRRRCGAACGARIVLHKRIPMEAGLGGGSSNAAAALIGLNRLWRLGLTSDDLHQFAAQLGSDVNFFLDSPGAAICRGRGEQIVPQPISSPLWLVLARPPVGLSTGEVFRRLREQAAERGAGELWPRSAAPMLEALARGDAAACGQRLYNALQPAAAQLCAPVSHLLEALQAEHVHGAAMTGSGSTCFGVCSSRRQAQRAAARLSARGDWRVWVVRTIA